MEHSSQEHPRVLTRLLFLTLLALAIPTVPTTLSAQDDFIRGDCLGDGEVGLGDVIWMLCIFCDPGPAHCYDACDADDDGIYGLSDTIYLISFLFEGDVAPPAPFPVCGLDPTVDALSCTNYQYDCLSGPSLPPFEPGYTLSIPDTFGSPGQTIDTAVELAIDESGITMASCSFGVGHDPTDLTFVGAQAGSDTVDADWVLFQSHDSGWTCLIILSIVGQVLYSDGNYQLATAQYQVLGAVGDSTSLEFVESLGDPPVKSRVVDSWGPESIPAMVAGSIAVTQPFRRGDTNGDGWVDVGDPVWSLTCLFSCMPSCYDAYDTNDDARWNIADPVYALSYLFAGGEPPPAPFPDCGADPTPDDLDCQTYNCR